MTIILLIIVTTIYFIVNTLVGLFQIERSYDLSLLDSSATLKEVFKALKEKLLWKDIILLILFPSLPVVIILTSLFVRMFEALIKVSNKKVFKEDEELKKKNNKCRIYV